MFFEEIINMRAFMIKVVVRNKIIDVEWKVLLLLYWTEMIKYKQFYIKNNKFFTIFYILLPRQDNNQFYWAVTLNIKYKYGTGLI